MSGFLKWALIAAATFFALAISINLSSEAFSLMSDRSDMSFWSGLCELIVVAILDFVGVVFLGKEIVNAFRE